jgi:hypothetical protein
MSHSDEPSDSSKPVVKDKDPHNYRKVGYSMIVISVSLVLIGLLVLAIGNNYHFAGDLMAGQEIDTMTPKSGYNLVVFDYTQPVGAKIKLLDHADDITYANKLKTNLEKEYLNEKGQVLIFDASKKNNTNSISLAEVFAVTPDNGYDVVSFNKAFPAGAKLSSLKLDLLLSDAQKDSQSSADLNKDPGIQILTLTMSYDDNLKQILGSEYNPNLVLENINEFKMMSPKLVVPKQVTPVPISSEVNQTKTSVQNATIVQPVNATIASSATVIPHISNQTKTQITNDTSTAKS